MFKNLDEVIKANNDNGYMWFNTKYFNIEIISSLMNFKNSKNKHFQVFSFSDYYDNAEQKVFNIAVVCEDGKVSMIGKPNGYSSERLAWENLGNDLHNFQL